MGDGTASMEPPLREDGETVEEEILTSKINLDKIHTPPPSTEMEESDSDHPQVSPTLLRKNLARLLPSEKESTREERPQLRSARLAEDRSRDILHARAKKLKHHFTEVATCDKIMAYGFIVIMFLLTGFYWFINIFSEEIRVTFQEYCLIAPAFVYGTAVLGVLNFFV